MIRQLVTILVTRLIVIDIAPLTVLFCSCLLVSTQSVSLVWLTSNHMFGFTWAIFRINQPRDFWKFLKFPLFYSGNFKIFKNALGQFVPNSPSKHVITSTNSYLLSEGFLLLTLKIFKAKWFTGQTNICHFEENLQNKHPLKRPKFRFNFLSSFIYRQNTK